MGISLEEYLKDRAACEHCVDTENQEHCVTELLSREDSCIFYNAYTKCTPDNRDESEIEAEVDLLTDLRMLTHGEIVLDYYVRASRIVRALNANPSIDGDFWLDIHMKYVTPIIVDLRIGNIESVKERILQMLDDLDPMANQAIEAQPA